MPSLKDFDDDSVMLDSVGAFAVEQPFCPRGACNNCFKRQFKIEDMKKGKKNMYASSRCS